jgi:hypothetical protein
MAQQGMMGGQPGPMPPGMVQGVMPLQMPPGAYGPPPGGYPPQGQPGYPPQMGPHAFVGTGQGGPGPSGAYPLPSGAMPAGGYPPQGPGGPSIGPGGPGGYGSTTPEGAQPGGMQSVGDVMKDPSSRKKIMALGVILLGGAYILLMDDEPEPRKKKPIAARDGGADAALGAAAKPPASLTVPPIQPQTSPCPPGFQPYGTVAPGQPITCVPMQPVDADAGAQLAAKDAGGPPIAVADAGVAAPPKITPGQQKTLERQAVDHVATGEYGKAIGIYEKLSQQFPDNKVYSEALRILRAKLDAGVP